MGYEVDSVEKEYEEELEDYDTLEVSKEDGVNEDYPNIAIKIDKDQYSVFEMKRKYDKEKLIMDPSFQRNFVWDSKKKSELIESVIMGIPLPPIYLAESKNGELVVVDGRQRLTTFFEYLNNRFSLQKLKILTELNGKKFKDLEKEYGKYASIIEDYQLIIQVIKYPTPDRVRFDIFDRVNRGGEPLNKQEMRNALYQGNATRLLKDIAESETFRRATGNGISAKRMRDRYIVLRALSFALLYSERLRDEKNHLIVYKSDMEDFLGNTMEYLNRQSEEEIFEIYANFCENMQRIYNLFGGDIFRIEGADSRKRPISMTLFETLYYLFYLLNGQGKDCVIKKKVQELLRDRTFLQALQHSVDSSFSVGKRFEKIVQCYEEIVYDRENKD